MTFSDQERFDYGLLLTNKTYATFQVRACNDAVLTLEQTPGS